MILRHDDEYDEPAARPTELTLGTGSIVAALVGLVLLCALCFWLGYTLRGGSRTATLPTAPLAEPAPSDATFNSFKPAAGSPLNAGTAATPSPTATTPTTPRSAPPAQPPAIPRSATPPAAVKPNPSAAAPTFATTQSTGGFYVQVAAVSRQQDADKLVATLHAQGYLASSHTSSQDTFFRVQIGPYGTRQDADLVRQKLTAEGYAPIVK